MIIMLQSCILVCTIGYVICVYQFLSLELSNLGVDIRIKLFTAALRLVTPAISVAPAALAVPVALAVSAAPAVSGVAVALVVSAALGHLVAPVTFEDFWNCFKQNLL